MLWCDGCVMVEIICSGYQTTICFGQHLILWVYCYANSMKLFVVNLKELYFVAKYGKVAEIEAVRTMRLFTAFVNTNISIPLDIPNTEWNYENNLCDTDETFDIAPANVVKELHLDPRITWNPHALQKTNSINASDIGWVWGENPPVLFQ